MKDEDGILSAEKTGVCGRLQRLFEGLFSMSGERSADNRARLGMIMKVFEKAG